MIKPRFVALRRSTMSLSKLIRKYLYPYK